jgi:molecular chaperone Hsp33
MDNVIRVMTNDHAFRVIACETTETCRGILGAQAVRGNVARALAELCTATILLRETMAPTLRVQGIAKGTGGRGRLIGDSFPDGSTRGLAQIKATDSKADDFSFGPGSVLQMMRSLPNGSLHQGIVDIQGAGGLSEALMVYLQESEQVVSVAAAGALFHEGELRGAGGYIVQLLPEAERPAHMIMTERLGDFASIDSFLEKGTDFSAQGLLDELLYGMPFTELGRGDLRFQCSCSETSLLLALATLGRGEIESMLEEGEGLDVTCDYCHRDYSIAIERLRALVARS